MTLCKCCPFFKEIKNKGGRMKIWGCYKNNKPEIIDEVPERSAVKYLHEYLLAFGPDWKLWLGLKKDEPNPRKEKIWER